GVGMDEETRLRCLEPFFSTKGERGTGLGLAMVYGTVQRHEGEIQIDSAPGAGTTVRLLLPACTSEETPAPAGIEPAAWAEGLKILVVDDEPVLLELWRDLLTQDGHQVVLAEGGEAGIEAFTSALAADRPFDVVITDLGMPKVSGRRVAESVRRASPNTPVILVTGWGARLQAEGDIPTGVTHVISKPLRLTDIRHALNEAAYQLKRGTVSEENA
ncbi:MAG: response regulator, partial [Armatimonadota bacterium]|nr:response regulator [Armatimonadota bacterium]